MTKLRVDQLSFSYPNRPVIKGLSIDFRAGELVALLGANGAGKTTLLRTIARQLKPSQGKVFLDDQDVATLGRLQFAKHIALMPQFELREVNLKAIDVVSLGRVPHRGWLMPLTSEDNKKIQDSMQATATWELRERPIHELSGGEWRRLVLARALAQDASVLLLDEPTAGLDLKYQFECLSSIRRLVKELGLLAVVTLHDLNQAALFADRVALLADHQFLGIDKPMMILTPSLIQRAFGIDVQVVKHPASETPLIVPLVGPKP